jgi:putative transposase
VLAVPPAYTSQDCSGVLPDGSRCTQRVAKSLSVRTHVCRSCGLVMDRDENAAQHSRRAGQARQAPTWVDAPSAAWEAPSFRHGEHVTTMTAQLVKFGCRCR